LTVVPILASFSAFISLMSRYDVFDGFKFAGRKVVMVRLPPRHHHQSYCFHVFPKNNLGLNSEGGLRW
jgi:hypothetical protein